MSTNDQGKISEAADWPVDGLEYLGHCPVCRAIERDLLYEGLRDRLFGAPGQWTMYRCRGCLSSYLDPRPAYETISLAYKHYFTHELRREGQGLSLTRKIMRNLANGYHNNYFNSQMNPAWSLGKWLALLTPGIRAMLDADMRHLSGKAGRLLDIGSGNGQFLTAARSAGWLVHGVEPDPVSANLARNFGLKITIGYIEDLPEDLPLFDMITVSHVLEHIHEPYNFLKRCARRLKVGGTIWIDTPNIECLGHLRYLSSWRGLEPPRHLVLFSSSSLQALLNEAGFESFEVMPYRPLCYRVWLSSAKLTTPQEPLFRTLRSAWHAERVARAQPELREFLTVLAYKK